MRASQMFFVLAVLLFGSVAVFGATDSALLIRNWERVEFGTHLGSAGLAVVDVDADGKEEILVSGGGYPAQFFMLLRPAGGGYVPRWTSPWYGDARIRQILTCDRKGDGDLDIFVFRTDDSVDIYDGGDMTLVENRALPCGSAVDVEIGDVDADGLPDLVMAVGSTVSVYGLYHFDLKNQITTGGVQDLAVGDVDGDGETEIVLSSGQVLNGNSLTTEWSYSEAFGIAVQLGDIDQDGIPEIVGMSNWDYLTAFDGVHHSPLWQIDTGDDHDALLVADTDGDNIPEILLGNGQWGRIHCYSSATQEELWNIPNPEHGVTRIAVGNTDGDLALEVLWGAGQTSSGEDYLYVGGTESHHVEWQSTDLDGPFNMAAADLDGRGAAELVVASHASDSGYGSGNLQVFDGVHQTPLWQYEASGYGSDIYGLAAAAPSRERDGIIAFGAGSSVRVVSAETHNEIWSSPAFSGTAMVVTIADVDDDGVVEIVAGDSRGLVYLYDGDSFAEEWHSIDTGNSVVDITVANVDDDPALELVFVGENGIIQIYDGADHLLQWQGLGITGVTAVTVGDIGLDGVKDIIAGGNDGWLTHIETKDYTVVDTQDLDAGPIRSLALANIDATRGPELLVGTDDLRALDPKDYTTIWQSEGMGTSVGRFGALKMIDIENDGHLEVLAGSSWGAFLFSSPFAYPDIVPPRVRKRLPPPGQSLVGLDTPVVAEFSEELDPATISLDHVVVTAAGTVIDDAELSFDAERHVLTFAPASLLPASSTITVTLTGGLADSTGNGLDGNGNGLGEGHPVDDVIWSFETGLDVDNVGPQVLLAGTDADSVWVGTEVELTATLSDSSLVAVTGVFGGEYFVDTLGEPGTGQPLIAVDDDFDSAYEPVANSLSTNGWSGGLHTIHLRGVDVRGNWGPPVSLDLFVLSPELGNWAMFGYDAQHSGYNAGAEVTGALTQEWTQAVSDEPLSQACVVNGMAYITTGGIHPTPSLYAVDERDGTPRWHHEFSPVFSISPPSFGYGMVFVQTCNHSGDSFVWAFDALTGTLLWQSPFSTQWEQFDAPTVAEGKVFVNGGSYGGLYGFDAFSGERLWFVNLHQYDEWTPAVYRGVVYAFVGEQYANGNSQLVAVDAQTGSILWDKTDLDFAWYGWSMRTVPVVDAAAGVLLVSSRNFLHAVNLADHEVLWSQTGTFAKAPAVHDGKVYLVRNNALEVRDVLTGDQQWIEASHAYDKAPILANGQVFLSGAAGSYSFDLATHQQMWSTGLSGQICVSEKRVFIAGANGGLACFADLSTPNFFQTLTARLEPSGVNFSWRITDETPDVAFRLVGRADGSTWEVPVTRRGDGIFGALDIGAVDHAEVDYELYVAFGGSDWQLMAAEHVQTALPVALKMDPARPNPFNAQTTFHYTLPKTGQTRVRIYDLVGRCVATLVDGRQERGPHVLNWNGRDHAGLAAASGTYFVRLETADGVRSQKIQMVK